MESNTIFQVSESAPASGQTVIMSGIISEEEIMATPMEGCQRELVTMHLRRLVNSTHEVTTRSFHGFDQREAACEQLARMTLTIRGYQETHRRLVQDGEIEIDEIIESMVADVVDACMHTGGRCGTYVQPIFVNPQLKGREQEIAELMQGMNAELARNFIERLNSARKVQAHVVPNPDNVDHIGKSIDWNKTVRRTRSDSNLLYRHPEELILEDRVEPEDGRESYHMVMLEPNILCRASDLALVKDKAAWHRSLTERKLDQLDLSVPPVRVPHAPTPGRLWEPPQLTEEDEVPLRDPEEEMFCSVCNTMSSMAAGSCCDCHVVDLEKPALVEAVLAC